MSIRVVDVETSQLGNEAEVIELAVVDYHTGEAQTWRFRPKNGIDPKAQAVHGISMADVSMSLTFEQSWAEDVCLREAIQDVSVWVGYNASFDVLAIKAELTRIGVAFDVANLTVVDPYRLWMHKERRRLEDAHRRFVGTSFEGAHTAAADCAATVTVLKAMCAAFELPLDDWSRLADECDPERKRRVGTKFRWHEDRVVFNFGRHKDMEVHACQPYLRWMLSKDFASVDHEVAAAVVEMAPDAFYEWVSRAYPPPEVVGPESNAAF